MSAHGPMPKSAWIFPALAMLLFAVATGLGLDFTPSVGGLLFAVVLLAILFGTVFAAVHHAEVIAERIGEPYGTLFASIGAPPAFEGVLVALLILLPESVAAIGAARKNDLQKSINLALGSSLATIGLTIPAVAVAAYTLDMQLVLGLNPQEMVLLVLTFVISMLTFGTGRTNILFGLVHIVVFAVFLFMVFVP